MAGELGYQTFLTQTLPQLAFHYRRKALEELEQKSSWLQTLATAKPDWISAKDDFFKDGTRYIHDLEEHVELIRLANVNEQLTRKFRDLYIIFMAELNAAKPTPGQKFKSEVHSTYLERIIGDVGQRRKEISEKLNTEGIVESLDSYFAAAQQTLIARQTRHDFDL